MHVFGNWVTREQPCKAPVFFHNSGSAEGVDLDSGLLTREHDSYKKNKKKPQKFSDDFKQITIRMESFVLPK